MSPNRQIPLDVADFSGGEADLPPFKMPPKYSVRMQNVYPTETGGPALVPGFTRLNSTSVNVAITNGHVFVKSDGTSITLASGGGIIYKLESGALTSILTGWDTAAKIRFCTYGDICIFTNGVDAPNKYNGTTVSALGGTPPAKAFKAIVHKSRVWMLERTDKLLASYSALEDAEDYTTAHNAGYFDFVKTLSSGDELVDIESYLDLLIFYFKNLVLVYSGNNPTDYGDFQLVQQVQGAGAIETDTVQSVGIDHFFLSGVGVRSLRQVINTGTDEEKLVSALIKRRLAGGVSGNYSGIYAAAHFARLGWYMVLIGDVIWCFSYNRGGWFRITDTSSYGIFSDHLGKVYVGGYGFLHQYDDGYDFDGVNPDHAWESAWLRFSKSGTELYIKEMEVSAITAKPTAFTVGARYDLDQGMQEGYQTFTTNPVPSLMDEAVLDVWEEAFFMDSGQYEPNRLPMFGGGSMLQLTFHSTADNYAEISRLKLYGVTGRR